jgi:hypothetical protein
MTTPAIAQIPIRTAADLTRRWEHLLKPPTFRARALWLTWFDSDGRQSPLLMPVDDIPRTPNPAMFDGLRMLNETVVDAQLREGCHLAMALCRPGNATPIDSDDEWVDALSEIFDDLVDQTWSLHLAAGGSVVELLGPPASAWTDGGEQ